MSERKYYSCTAWCAGRVSICYKAKQGFFDTPIRDIVIYFYEEDGKYYEFFSGVILAEKTSGGKLVIPESKLELKIGTTDSYGSFISYEMTPSLFAERVKRYIDSREMISNQIKNLLKEAHNKWVEEQNQIKRKELTQKTEQQNNESWLENILNSRN